MKEIHDTLETAVPTPRGYGPCRDRPGTYFYVCDYIAVTHDLPDPVRLGKKLAELHHSSKSPNGMFGFHCPTYDGDQIINTTWDSSWTAFFKRRIHEAYLLDLERNGPWKLYEDVVKIALEKLIPRLLDVLTDNGRAIRPVLIHGDLWESNIGTDEETDEIYFWDACAYYAHHEREVAMWRCAHHQMTDEKYRGEYFKNYPPSEPRQEADDRNRLYSVEILMNNGLSFPGAKTRQLAVQEFQYLIAKYLPEGQAGSEQVGSKQVGSEEVGREQVESEQVDSEQVGGEQKGSEQKESELGGEKVGSEQVENQQVENKQVENKQVKNKQVASKQLESKKVESKQEGSEPGGEKVGSEQVGCEQVGREQVGGEQVEGEQVEGEQVGGEQVGCEEVGSEQQVG